MNSSAYELAGHLQAQGLGTLGTDIFVASEPPAPDACTTLYDTGGSAPVLFDENLRAPSIQVRVRDNSYNAAHSQQQSAFDALNAIIQEQIGQHYYTGVWLTSDIISLGRDESGRFVLTANYEIERESI